MQALEKSCINKVIQQEICLYQLQSNERTEKWVLQNSECHVPLPSQFDKNYFTLAAMNNFDHAEKKFIWKNACSSYSYNFISSATKQPCTETPKRHSWSNQCSKPRQTALSGDLFVPSFSKFSTQWLISCLKWFTFGPNI